MLVIVLAGWLPPRAGGVVTANTVTSRSTVVIERVNRFCCLPPGGGGRRAERAERGVIFVQPPSPPSPTRGEGTCGAYRAARFILLGIVVCRRYAAIDLLLRCGIGVDHGAGLVLRRPQYRLHAAVAKLVDIA